MPEPRCAYFVADAHLGQGSSDSNRGRERDLLRLFDLVLSQRAALYDVGGNHDFWIGDYLRRELDVAFTDAPLPLTIQGRRILLAHGDGMGPGDRGYKLLKRVLRNRLSRWLFRWIHPDIGIPLATMTSRTSRDHAPRVKRSEGWLLETLARPVFHDGFDALVLAHFHIPVHRRESDGELVVLGDWIERRTYARLEGGVFRLEDFRDGPAS